MHQMDVVLTSFVMAVWYNAWESPESSRACADPAAKGIDGVDDIEGFGKI
jgi:hypothetical protein